MLDTVNPVVVGSALPADGNVVDQEVLQRKRNEKNDKRRKDLIELSPAEAYMNMADHINGKPAFTDAEPFPAKFHVAKPTEGARHLLREYENGLVKRVPESELDSEIICFVSRVLRFRPSFKWAMKHCREARDVFMHETTPVPTPAVVKWDGEEGLAYSVLPWKFNPDARLEDAPLFQEMFSRMTNAQAAQLWIGSLFDIDSYLQQYLYLYGEGNNGKSTLARFIAKVFDNAFAAMDPQLDNNHLTQHLMNKRIIYFGDLDDPEFVLSGSVKRWSGEDAIFVNPKKRDSFSIRPTWKLLFSANVKPRIPSKEADTRRIIFCEMEAISKEVNEEQSSTYESRLWEEGGTFLSYCIQLYRKLMPLKGKIPVDKDALLTLTDETEEDYAFMADKHLAFHPDYWVAPGKVKAHFREKEKMRNPEIDSILNFCKAKRRCHKGTKHPPHVSKRGAYWIGMSLKDDLKSHGIDVNRYDIDPPF